MCSFCYVRSHDIHNKPKNASIAVTNHTSPLDALILARKQMFSLTGQKMVHISGQMQKILSMCGDHLWFERSKIEDRKHVVQKMTEYVQDKTRYPILVFPEGTCISNKAVMLFNKGSFEVPGVTIYPAAIKYDPRFADPFWNSSHFSLHHFVLRLATSWGLVCDIHYLEPQKKRENETGIEFARRVKQMITSKGNFLDLDWDGQLKRTKPKPEKALAYQNQLAQKIMTYTSSEEAKDSWDADHTSGHSA